MKNIIAQNDYVAIENSIIDTIKISDFVDSEKYNLKNAWINIGGWQSWNPGFEVEPGHKQPALECHFIKAWNKYLKFPETSFKPSKKIILGQFITYLRWNDFYLFFASVGNVENILPPIQFIFNRKSNSINIEIYDKGKQWKKDDLQAQLEIFTAESYFEAKKKIAELYKRKQFDSVAHLGDFPAGWESWYNHYADINETLILNNLSALSNKENIISKGNYSSKVFQIDDGWEQALGEWDFREDRFPNGLKTIVDRIESDGYIPGLWIAPFIIDERCKTAKEHPEWILQDENGKKIVSGFNPLWGEKGNFYCLDLSNDDVINHLDSIMERAINEWGFRYLKLDFLYAGMLFGNFKNKTAAYNVYNRAISILTSRKQTKTGEKVCYLGCGVPFEASIDYLPLSRIGCDTLEHWENKKLRLINWNGRNEAYLNIKDTLGHALWNKTIFLNDPDVIFVREKKCSLNSVEKLLIAKINTMFGSQLMYSDDPDEDATEEELKITKEILDFVNNYKNVEFGLKQVTKDLFKIYSEDNSIKAELSIGKKRYLKFM